jgi:hypothetical protein
MVVSALVLVGALVLVSAGLAKAVRPHGTARALQAAGRPLHPHVVRAVAALEVAVALAVAGTSDRVGVAAMAVSYAGFTAFVALGLRKGSVLSSCGCFGAADAPPTLGHLVVNATFATVAGVAAVTDTAPALAGFWRHPAQGIALAFVAIVTTGLVVLALTRLPALAAASRSS